MQMFGGRLVEFQYLVSLLTGRRGLTSAAKSFASVFTYRLEKGSSVPHVEEVDITPFDSFKQQKARLFSLKPVYVPPAYLNHELPKAGKPEIAFIGRSNVGKSSLVEALLGAKGLLRISKEPGCTTTLNFYSLAKGARLEDHSCYLIDMPGYGFAKVAKTQQQEWLDIVKNYFLDRDQLLLRRVFVLVDGRRGLLAQDVEVMALLDSAHIPYQVILTKRDLVSEKEVQERLFELFCVLLRKRNNSCFPHVHVVSAREGMGLEELQLMITEIVSR